MYLILLFAFVSICLTSKLSLKVSCDKLIPGEKNLILHLMIQMDMKSNDFTHPELAGRLSAIVNSR